MANQDSRIAVQPLEHEHALKAQKLPVEAVALELTSIGKVVELGKTVPELEDGNDGKMRRKRIKLRKGIKVPVYGEITWRQLWKMAKVWMMDPMNIALVLWLLISAIDFTVLASVELGLLNKVVEDHEVREEIKEVTTQILNALFVLMTVIFHPTFCRHTLLLFRWKPKDIEELRQYYNRGGFEKPKEWIHTLNLVILLHLTSLAMYAFAIIYWVYPQGDRPTSAVLITLVLSFVFPVLAFMYFVACPLQKDYNEVPIVEGKAREFKFIERNMVFATDGKIVEHPEWQGDLVLGCLDKKRTALASCFLPFLVFGLTSHRLRFGHKFVQASVFLLMVIGPMLVFELAARYVEDHVTHRSVTILGIFLAWTGLIYGAVWRIHMRKTYRLPSSRLCCGSSGLTDTCIWLFCPFCALCQEARTAGYYQIVELGSDGELYFSKDDLEDGCADLSESDEENDSMQAPTVQPPFGKSTQNSKGFVRLVKL